MHYTRLMKSYAQTPIQQPVQQVEHVDDTPSEMVLLLRKMAEQQCQIPKALEESVLDDAEVNMILEDALNFQSKYFSNIPLNRDILKPFLYNVPKNVYEGAKYMRNHPETPDVLNPVLLLYLFLTKEPADSIGVYLIKLSELIDGSREAIKDDALKYIADQRYEEEMEELEDE